MAEAAKRYSTFAVFYPLNLSEHANRTCRRLHFVGTSIGLAFLLHTFFNAELLVAAGRPGRRLYLRLGWALRL